MTGGVEYQRQAMMFGVEVAHRTRLRRGGFRAQLIAASRGVRKSSLRDVHSDPLRQGASRQNLKQFFSMPASTLCVSHGKTSRHIMM